METEMKIKKIILSVAALALIAIVVSNVSVARACYLPGLSPGYWKHNVKVYCGGPGSYSGDPHETAATMVGYETYIKAHFYSGFSLALANMAFQDNQYKGYWLMLANWFNAAAGRLPYSG
jgi:hypothetical protein